MSDKVIDGYVPTRAPYRIQRTSPLTGNTWEFFFDDQRAAMASLMRETPYGAKAELTDADGTFIAKIGPSAAVSRS